MAGKGQDSSVIADLNIRLGVVTDETGLTQFVKNVQKTIDKATFNDGKKKLGYSDNFKILEAGVKRYRKLLEEIYKTAEKLSLTENGGFKRNADGSISSIEKAYKNLQKGLRGVEGAFAKADPTSLKIQNQMVAAQLRSVRLSERLAKQEEKRKRESLQITAELNKHNTLLGGMQKKFGQLGGMVQQYFNLWAIKGYLENILHITAEFDRQRRALGSLINDQSKAISMFNQIKNMALNSPYTTLELTRTAKGLAAYDIETKDLIKDTKMLGDVAAATGVDIQRLVLAYGQVKTATWLKGQEARQFSEAGVPILRALANRYSATEGRNVTAREVQERMSNRQISFEDVQAALRAMTEEGGKFYNMQEIIAETTYGKIQKIKDAWQQGFEQMSNGGTINSLIHGFLDTVVKIAKNINGIVPHLLTIGTAMLVINKRGKLTMKYAEKELALIERRAMLEKQRDRWANIAKTSEGKDKDWANRMATYYGSQIPGVENQLTATIKNNNALQDINAKIQQNAQSTKFWNKRVKVFEFTFRRLGMTAKQVLGNIKTQLKAFAASNWITLVLMAAVELFNVFRNIGQATRQLNKDLKSIETESAKKTTELINGFEKNAKIAVKAADGSKKQADALSTLAQTYGEIIPLEQMSIENLKKLEGNYESLTKQIELYQALQEGKEKRSTIIESDKYKDDFKNSIDRVTYETENNKFGVIEGGEAKDMFENISTALIPEIQDERIQTLEEYKKRIQEELEKEGYTIKIDDIHLDDDFEEAFEELRKRAGTKEIKEALFGKRNADVLREQERLLEAQKEEIDNAKTGREFVEERNRLLEKYADTMSKTLGNGISKAEAMKFLMGEINDVTVLQGKNIKENSELYNQTLQTMTAMKNNFYGLYDGINMFSVKSKEVLDIWKDSLIQAKNLKNVLEAGSDDPYRNYLSKKQLKDNSKEFFETVKQNEVMQGFNENGYNLSKKEIDYLLATNKYNAKERQAYFDNWKRNRLTSTQLVDMFGEDKAAVISKNLDEAEAYIDKFLPYFLEEYEVDEKKTGGSGESRIGKWKREMNEWIGVLDKARQHYKELGDLFFDETALDKTVKAYEKQFKMYEGQFMDIMKQVNITSLKEWISTEENYVKGLEAIIAKVDEMIAKAKGKDLKDLQEFKFFLSQKISTEQIKNIKEAIKRFMEEVERQMEVVSGRMDIWKNIFEKTNNTHLADMFAKTFSGSGSKDAIKTMRSGIMGLVSKAMELPDKELDKYGKEVLDKITKMFDSNVIDFSAMESLMSDPQIPIEVRSQMLKIFKEFKQANQQILESGLEYYQKTRTLEEQRVDVYVKAQQRINDISKMPIADNLKNKVIENVLKGIRSQLAELELEAIKSSDVYLTLFNNIEQAGVSSLKMLRDQIEALKDSFKDDPVNLKALNSELKKIDDQLEPKQYKFSDIFNIPSAKELNELFNEVDEATAKVQESREKEQKLVDRRTEIENRREAKRSSKETEQRIMDLAREIYAKQPENDANTQLGMQYAKDQARMVVDKEIDEEFNGELEATAGALKAQTDTTMQCMQKEEEARMKIVQAESLRIKAIEQMSKRIEKAFQFSSNLLDFGNNVANSLTANAIFKGKNSDGNMMNVYANDVQSAFSAVTEYNNAFKGVMDSALNLWKGISGAFADKNSREAINNRTPVDRNTSALLELTNAIYDWRNMITGQSTPENFVQAYKNDQNMQNVDKKKKIDGQMIASIGLGAGLSAINMIGSGDYRSGSKGMMSTVGSGLMSTGDPYMMIGGAALQIGSAIWDAADKIHDSDIEKAIENLQDKFDDLSDVITATNNKIRKSTGNEVISGKRQNIQTQQMQVKNLEKQLALYKTEKGASDKEIKNYEKRIQELKQSIESAEMDLFESILGSGIDEYMNNLVSVFEEAAKSGENTFKALKNSFGESLSSMVQDTIMTTIIKNRLQKFFEQVKQISKQGGMGIGMTDDIIATGLEAMQDVNSDLKNMQPLIRQINTAFRVNSSTVGSLASGVKGMSEETAGQMSGYLIANFDRLGEIQKSVFAIEKVVSGNTASGMMTQFQQDAITHLAQIEANTLRNANKLDQFYSLIDSMKVVNTSGSGAVYGIQTVN